jgi:hypothetical protein
MRAPAAGPAIATYISTPAAAPGVGDRDSVALLPEQESGHAAPPIIHIRSGDPIVRPPDVIERSIGSHTAAEAPCITVTTRLF